MSHAGTLGPANGGVEAVSIITAPRTIVRRTPDHKTVWSITAKADFIDVATAHNKQSVAAICGRTIAAFDYQTGKLLWKVTLPPKGQPNEIRYADDDSKVVVKQTDGAYLEFAAQRGDQGTLNIPLPDGTVSRFEIGFDAAEVEAADSREGTAALQHPVALLISAAVNALPALAAAWDRRRPCISSLGRRWLEDTSRRSGRASPGARGRSSRRSRRPSNRPGACGRGRGRR